VDDDDRDDIAANRDVAAKRCDAAEPREEDKYLVPLYMEKTIAMGGQKMQGGNKLHGGKKTLGKSRRFRKKGTRSKKSCAWKLW